MDVCSGYDSVSGPDLRLSALGLLHVTLQLWKHPDDRRAILKHTGKTVTRKGVCSGAAWPSLSSDLCVELMWLPFGG
jgi:hypothetical protein